MIAAGQMIPVELCGGPLDGFKADRAMQAECFDMHLFAYEAGGRRFTLGYRFASRTSRRGSRWVLEFACVVAAWPLVAEGGEEAA